ncbi:MAG: ParA family protein [Chloroflexi bacterium]|nr:ParA family protein [Chloroflexota bacterium]
MAAKVVSILNLKGGVGKSTIAMMLAEYMAFVHGKKVLVIDLDSQANLTAAMVRGLHIQEELVPKGYTIYKFFRDLLDGEKRVITDYVCPNCQWVSNIDRSGSAICLDMVVSCAELAFLDDELLKMWEGGKPFPGGLRFALREALLPALPQYHAIIIDCPPVLSLPTTAAMVASDYYVCPVIPERLSIVGVDLTKDRVARIKRDDLAVTVDFAGSIINKFMRRTTHLRETNLLNAVRWKDIDPYRIDQYRPVDYWIPDAEALRRLSQWEVEIDEPRWVYGPTYPYFDTPSRKWGGWARAEATNPDGYAIDRSTEEGKKYLVSRRLGALVQEFMEKTGISG